MPRRIPGGGAFLEPRALTGLLVAALCAWAFFGIADEVAEGETDDGLSATIYRLRRRIERATPTLVPLQSKSRVGYVFRAPLQLL